MEQMPIYTDKIKFLEAVLNDELTKIRWSKEERRIIQEKIEELKKEKEVKNENELSL